MKVCYTLQLRVCETADGNFLIILPRCHYFVIHLPVRLWLEDDGFATFVVVFVKCQTSISQTITRPYLAICRTINGAYIYSLSSLTFAISIPVLCAKIVSM